MLTESDEKYSPKDAGFFLLANVQQPRLGAQKRRFPHESYRNDEIVRRRRCTTGLQPTWSTDDDCLQMNCFVNAPDDNFRGGKCGKNCGNGSLSERPNIVITAEKVKLIIILNDQRTLWTSSVRGDWETTGARRVFDYMRCWHPRSAVIDE